ncbi:hypothetical protein AAG612_03860 [Citromicrobium bathyomarinum]|uniref:hypothetical protein n=1 Tax=Citromicrobium bathyomarinum TaxID=72174 RepID=UPI00315A3832
MRIGWYTQRRNPKHASARLRVHGPMAQLAARGHECVFYDGGHSAEGLDCIVISKSFTRTADKVMDRAQAAGVPVLYDMCDNLIAKARAEGDKQTEARVIAGLQRAALITAPTPDLLARLAEQVAGVPLKVVPDMLENTDFLAGLPLSLLERWRLTRLRRFLTRHDEALHCVWFGNSAGKHAGLVHVAERMSELEAFARSHPITLTIISDTWFAYRKVGADFGIPSHYMSWSLAAFLPALRAHRVAVIPVGRSSFTLGKSINRPATALRAGLGVVADALPAYEELRDFVAIDDWQGGLARYACDWNDERERLAQGLAHIDARYGDRAVADRWEEALQAAIPAHA